MEKLKIFAHTIEEEALQQIHKLNECEAYNDSTIRIMPDAHAGKGCTIGSVIRFRDKVIPCTIGVDVCCGMLVTELGKVDIDLAELDRVVNEKIPSGFNIHDKAVAQFNMDFVADIKDKDYLLRSIGTLGCGNHFIELDADDKGNKYLVIHSGSRNLGVQVCNYYQNIAIRKLSDNGAERKEIIEKLKKEGRQKEINEVLKELPRTAVENDLAYIEGDDLADYLHDMLFCAVYAKLNRETMAMIICNSLGLEPKEQFTTLHNYIDVLTNTVRKGAISAQRGEKVIIPMNMRDGSLICIGKGNEDWLWSAPHGAGRLMSRKKAKEMLSMDDFKQSMDGVYSTSVCYDTIDEAPMAYKPMEEIMDCIKPTVDVLRVIKPLYNFKAK